MRDVDLCQIDDDTKIKMFVIEPKNNAFRRAADDREGPDVGASLSPVMQCQLCRFEAQKRSDLIAQAHEPTNPSWGAFQDAAGRSDRVQVRLIHDETICIGKLRAGEKHG